MDPFSIFTLPYPQSCRDPQLCVPVGRASYTTARPICQVMHGRDWLVLLKMTIIVRKLTFFAFSHFRPTATLSHTICSLSLPHRSHFSTAPLTLSLPFLVLFLIDLTFDYRPYHLSLTAPFPCLIALTSHFHPNLYRFCSLSLPHCLTSYLMILCS